MNQFVDLHMHTNCSDGILSPGEVLERVRSAQLAAFAITDHDTLVGFRSVHERLKEGDAELISGIELSANYKEADLHILAYGFDPDFIPLKNALTKFQESRSRRGRKMVEKLNKLGVNITYAEVQKKAGEGVIGRPHVAEAIFDSGVIKRYNEAFERFIGVGGPAYVPKANFTPAEAIELVHSAGGVAVLAHPGVGEAYQHLEVLVGMGLDGIEVFHPEHSTDDKERFKNMAQEFGLSITGGSDFHGREGRNDNIGSQKVSYIYLSHLLEKTKAYK